MRRENAKLRLAVIASEATCPPKPWRRRKQSMARRNERMDCFVAFAPLRKRFAFVAGNVGGGLFEI
jgi:hypothetical protein